MKPGGKGQTMGKYKFEEMTSQQMSDTMNAALDALDADQADEDEVDVEIEYEEEEDD